MSKLAQVLGKIAVPTCELSQEVIQEALHVSKVISLEDQESWNKIAEILREHLLAGLNNLDDQLLSATCFYSIIVKTDKQETYLIELLKLFKEELVFKQQYATKSKNTFLVVSLLYGLFQSSFLTQKNEHFSKITEILHTVFNLLLIMGHEFTQYTFVVFKTLKAFKKLCGTDYEREVFTKDNQMRLLNFINHNWENPVTGVRDMNRCIFHTLWYTMDAATSKIVLEEINTFYWNKAKYLMLSELIVLENERFCIHLEDKNWADGLVYSLHKPGLVSAGADMYYAILKFTKSTHDWCESFLLKILNIFKSSRNKAIENFINYWCLATFKKFPDVAIVLINKLDKLDESDQILLGKLSIMKQAKKLDIINKNNHEKDIESVVRKGTVHCNSNIRLVAFDILCLLPRRTVPTFEYGLITDFFKNNINSDCTVLRIGMLNSTNIFLIQLHSTFLNIITKHDVKEDHDRLLEFCKRLQLLIMDSINLDGNYQRKITSLKLCYITWLCFSEIPKKRKDHMRNAKLTFVENLKQNNCWLLNDHIFLKKLLCMLKDPADDIRDNVSKVLLQYYSTELKETSVLNELTEDAKTVIKSKYFYDIKSGQSMFKLINALLADDVGLQQQVQEMFYFTYNEFIEAVKTNMDAMRSIETGKQLHSYLGVLLVFVESYVSKSNQFEIPNVAELLDKLDDVSNQFHWQDNATSSDFSKMSDMVEKMIADSGRGTKNETDSTKISGLHQMLLNSLWLNVKASCDLASVLIQMDNNDITTCERCLNIITRVLETSRHKGAIEAGGAALGRAIQYLTSVPKERDISKLPSKYLRQKLNDLISETNTMTSITRRGAGLSIMVHRIVSSDANRGKPLFHYFITTLLDVCKTTSVPDVKDLNENQVDLPLAIYIHFMTRIVTDSSLASELMFYSADLAELAFNNLTSPHWQIRNAALQLYGALIPRLIGQRKASGNDDETIATVACDEFRTHSPKLWTYIIEQLQQIKDETSLEKHSNLVPILNLLANSAKRYNFSNDLKLQKPQDWIMMNCLVSLLGSPIYTVRRLTAKCIFNMHTFPEINAILETSECMSENFLHGCLLLFHSCHKYYSSNEIYSDNFKQLKEKFSSLLHNKSHSYLCKSLFEELFPEKCNIQIANEVIREVTSNSSIPGVHLWAEIRLKQCIETVSNNEIPKLLPILLQRSVSEKYIELISTKLTQDIDEPEILSEIVNTLLSQQNKYQSSMTWKLIYEISFKIDLSNNINIPELIDHLKNKESLYTLRYTVPLIARIVSTSEPTLCKFLIDCIEKISSFEVSDVDMRCIAAICNNELAKNFRNLPDFVKIVSLKCAIMLLQDEDDDVRNISVEYYKLLSKQENTVHPYISLNNILNKEFLSSVVSPQSIQNLCKELTKLLHSNHSTDEYNPFANDSKNIYLEVNVLKQFIDKLSD